MLLFGQGAFSGGINVNTEWSFLILDQAEMSSGISVEGETTRGYSIGAHISYPLSTNLHLRSGLSYEQSTYRTKVNGLIFGSDIINGTTSSIENGVSISSIGIPLDLIYKIPLKSGNSKFLFGIGSLLNVILIDEGRREVKTSNGGPESLTETGGNFNSLQASLVAFTGFEIDLEKKISFSIEPHFKYILSDIRTYPLEQSSIANVFESGVTVRVGFF